MHNFYAVFNRHNKMQLCTFIRYDTKSTHHIDCRLCPWRSSPTLYAQFRQILNYALDCIFPPSKYCQFKKIAYLCKRGEDKGQRRGATPNGYTGI